MFQIGPKAVFPRVFRYVPHTKPLRPLIVTEIKVEGPQAILVVQPGCTFQITEPQYQMLFMRDDGPLYDRKMFKDEGPVVIEEEKKVRVKI
jgi:hypothetical protein